MKTYERAKDWRESYVICEHLADLEGENPPIPEDARATGFRVCCRACYEDQDGEGRPRFLFEELERTERGGFCVGRVAP